MTPGNRADFLINIPRGGKGKYKLVKDRYPADATDPNSGIPAGDLSARNKLLLLSKCTGRPSTRSCLP